MKTAAIFQDGMLLQREKPVAIWGTAKPKEHIKVTIQGKEGVSVVKDDGTFLVKIPELKASNNETMTITTDSEDMIISDIAIGEVWLAGGQSNMEFCMRYEKHKGQALASCVNENIRFFDVPEVAYDGQIEDFDYSNMGIWRKANPENLDFFSAVGYYFQRDLEADLNVPVGIIGCNWGGSTTCSWMSKDTVKKAGPAWIEYTEKRMQGKNLDEYWASQHTKQINNRGNLFDEFSEFVMPRTPSQEELKKFFDNASDDNQEDWANLVMPQSFPGSLYEHMLKTVSPYSIRGFLWYQGESDDDVPGMNVLHKDMLTALIHEWRQLWDEELPFMLVQLPGYRRWLLNPENNHYQVIRQCQEEVAKSVPHTYMCSISDIGEEMDIHPKNKKDVGQRLSLLARHYVYGEDLLCEAPSVSSARKEGNQIIITFNNAGNSLSIESDKLNAMVVVPVNSIDSISDDTEKVTSLDFTASVSGNELTLTLSQMPKGNVQVEFADTMWYQVNLYNEAHIPAIPFSFVI